jgi:lipoate-protein ligase A
MFNVTFNGRKLSGCAQRRQREGVLHHGSLPVSIDRDKVVECLIQPVGSKVLHSQMDRMISLGEASPLPVTRDQVREAIVMGWEKHFGVSFLQGKLDPVERSLADNLSPKYSSEDWINKY